MKFEAYNQEALVKYNNLNTAFIIINNLQNGNEDSNHLIHALLFKKLRLVDQSEGYILRLAIQMQNYVAAAYIAEHFTILDDEELIAEDIRKSECFYNGPEDLERFINLEGSNPVYQRKIEDYKRNIAALKFLKERYLGVTRVRE